MQAALAAQDYRFDSLLETVVMSPQFRNKRVPVIETQIAEKR